MAEKKTVLITGGCGFIGTNAAEYYLNKGFKVVVFDNLSRVGAKENLKHLKTKKGLIFIKGDIRNSKQIESAFKKYRPDYVLHLAAQVTMVTSVQKPREDFEINALGTFNVLEALRKEAPEAALLYSSTNKVYGEMQDLETVEKDKRYEYRDFKGIDEKRPLDFHGPYGCCYSADTDILTDNGWKKFTELTSKDKVLTYNIEKEIAEYQKPTEHFSYKYEGKMYVQANRRLKTCVTPNHKMLVGSRVGHNGIKNPKLLTAESIDGKARAYLLAAELNEGERKPNFLLPEVRPEKKNEHLFTEKKISMDKWLHFLGWYISEGHCDKNNVSGNYSIVLTSYHRKNEAVKAFRDIGLVSIIKEHHIVATSKQLYTYLKKLGKSHDKYIPQDIKKLHPEHLAILLKSLLAGDGNKTSKNSWRYTTVSKRLADDVQEIAIKCGIAASTNLDKEGFYRVQACTTRTAQCNLDAKRSSWINYKGMVYCVEVPNSTVMVRQNGYAYFSGNSKGTGDQYTIDWARIYGLKTVVFRQSGIYGPHQFGIEEQGWLAWFINALLFEKPVTIYGDGKQVRDVLYVDDVLDAYDKALMNINETRGKAFNIGGGTDYSLSIWELFEILEKLSNKKFKYTFGDWRPGDQKAYISDISKAKNSFDWCPKVSPKEGVEKLYAWIAENKEAVLRAGVFPSNYPIVK